MQLLIFRNTPVQHVKVIRDYHGCFVAASYNFMSHVPSAAMTEALAMRHGLDLAVSISVSDVEAQSDSMEVIQ
jgi:hypothetical protein